MWLNGVPNHAIHTGGWRGNKINIGQRSSLGKVVQVRKMENETKENPGRAAKGVEVRYAGGARVFRSGLTGTLSRF